MVGELLGGPIDGRRVTVRTGACEQPAPVVEVVESFGIRLHLQGKTPRMGSYALVVGRGGAVVCDDGSVRYEWRGWR